MPLAYLFDEHLRGPLWRAIDSHNRKETDIVDAIRVGDVMELHLGIGDADILQWAERERRILVSFDRSTLPAHLEDYLKRGRESPGIFLIRRTSMISEVVHFLVLAAHASEPEEWANRVKYVPL